MTPEQILLEFYKEQTTHGRHTETQRLEVTKFVLVAVAALLGVMGTMKFSIYCIPLALGIIYLGIFGRQMAQIYADRFDGHIDRARCLRHEIDNSWLSGNVQRIFDSDPVVKDKKKRLRDFWRRIYSFLVVLGFVCLVWILLAVGARWTKQSGSCTDKLIEQFADIDSEKSKSFSVSF